MTYNSSFTGAQVDESVTKTQAAGTTLLGTGNTPIQPNATNLILDSGARLGIGTASPDASADVRGGAVPLHIHGDADLPGVALHNTAGQLKWAIASRGVSGDALFFSASPLALTGPDIASAAQMSLLQNGEFRIGPLAAERLRIDSSGQVLIGDTSLPTSNPQFFVKKSSSGSEIATFTHSAASNPYGISARFTGASPNNTTNYFATFIDSTTTRVTLRSNGGLANFSANNVNLSDQRAKKDIADSGNYLDRLLQIPVRNFRYKDQDADGKHHLGVIAQEVEAVCPEFVNRESFEFNGEKMDSVYNTDLMFAMLKAIQELKTDNDSLRARIEALENKQ